MEKLTTIITCICCAFLLWVGVSWVDVIADNNAPDPTHSNYNFFVVLTNTWEESI